MANPPSVHGNVFETAEEYATRARKAAQPHVDAAIKAMQSGASSAVDSVHDFIPQSTTSGSVAPNLTREETKDV